MPTVYYAYDVNFLDYFGSNGVVSVDGAFAVMNSLTNVSSYSPSLWSFRSNPGISTIRRRLWVCMI